MQYKEVNKQNNLKYDQRSKKSEGIKIRKKETEHSIKELEDSYKKRENVQKNEEIEDMYKKRRTESHREYKTNTYIQKNSKESLVYIVQLIQDLEEKVSNLEYRASNCS